MTKKIQSLNSLTVECLIYKSRWGYFTVSPIWKNQEKNKLKILGIAINKHKFDNL